MANNNKHQKKPIGKKKAINKIVNKSTTQDVHPLKGLKILELNSSVYEPVLIKYVNLRERNTNYIVGELSEIYKTDVLRIYTDLVDEIGFVDGDNIKILAILIHQLLHQEIQLTGYLDIRLNIASKLQQGIFETMQAIELFEKNALNVEGIRFTVRRKPLPKDHPVSSSKHFERTNDAKSLTTAYGIEVVKLVMKSLIDKKSEFEELLRLHKENDKLRKKYPTKESITRTKIASRLTKKIYAFLTTEIAMKKAEGIHVTAKILNFYGLMPELKESTIEKRKKKMYDLCRKYLNK